MESDAQQEREVRAARNQALFRAVNEKIEELNQAFQTATETFAIACECADTTCVEMIEVDPADYATARAEPRHFLVREGHVFPDVEVVVRAAGDYIVVEKIAAAGEVAEVLDAETPPAATV